MDKCKNCKWNYCSICHAIPPQAVTSTLFIRPTVSDDAMACMYYEKKETKRAKSKRTKTTKSKTKD